MLTSLGKGEWLEIELCKNLSNEIQRASELAKTLKENGTPGTGMGSYCLRGKKFLFRVMKNSGSCDDDECKKKKSLSCIL